MSKLAVVFPGIGYHTDKPLLYYSKKIAMKNGYEILNIDYHDLPHGIKGDSEKMKKAGYQALAQVKEELQDVDFEKYEDILFLSKSIGTALAAQYALDKEINPRQVFYTPVEESFPSIGTVGIAFSGTKDQWARHEVIVERCRERHLPLYVIEGGNHSLETEDALLDIRNLEVIMQHTWNYIVNDIRDHSDVE